MYISAFTQQGQCSILGGGGPWWCQGPALPHQQDLGCSRVGTVAGMGRRWQEQL